MNEVVDRVIIGFAPKRNLQTFVKNHGPLFWLSSSAAGPFSCLLSRNFFPFSFLLLCALLTGVILKGLTLRIFVSDVCVCMFYVYEVIGSVD